jgi:hypothetical protein
MVQTLEPIYTDERIASIAVTQTSEHVNLPARKPAVYG